MEILELIARGVNIVIITQLAIKYYEFLHITDDSSVFTSISYVYLKRK